MWDATTGRSTGSSDSSTAGCVACLTGRSVTPPSAFSLLAATAGGPPSRGHCRAQSLFASTCTAGKQDVWRSAQSRGPGDEAPDRFLYDPDTPVAWWLEHSLWDLASGLGDRRPLESRSDVLVYTSEPLAADLEVVGPLSVTLSVASSAPDTDFTAALVDVFPDGYAQLVQEGIVRIAGLEGALGSRSVTRTWSVYCRSPCAPLGTYLARGTACVLRFQAATSVAMTATSTPATRRAPTRNAWSHGKSSITMRDANPT